MMLGLCGGGGGDGNSATYISRMVLVVQIAASRDQIGELGVCAGVIDDRVERGDVCGAKADCKCRGRPFQLIVHAIRGD